MRAISIGLAAVLLFGSATAADNTIQDTFYARCVADGQFVSDVASLSDTCRCTAQVFEGQLTPRATEQAKEAIRTGKEVFFDGNPFKTDAAGMAMAMIQECPGVIPAVRKQFCEGPKMDEKGCAELEKIIQAQ